MVTKGDKAVVVRGVKVPRGTTGVVIWVGETKYGARVGLKDATGEVHWTAAGNVEPVAAAAPAVAKPAAAPTLVAMAGALDANARIAALEARVAALEAALAAGAPAPAAAAPAAPATLSAALGEDYGNLMEYRLVLDEMAAGGDAAALAELTVLDARLAAAERRAA